MKLAWYTDLHLEFLSDTERGSFLKNLREVETDAIALSGDIAVGTSVIAYLKLIEQAVKCPVYFVCGNHDYYHSSVKDVRSAVRELCRQSKRLIWLSEAAPQMIREGIAVVGHDSWADGRYGDYSQSPVMLNDFELIDELRGLSRAERLYRMQELAGQAVEHLRDQLPVALAQATDVILVTHVPPFREACRYGGRICDAFHLPFFASMQVGDYLLEEMQHRPGKRLTVLCGHTHAECDYQPTPNIRVLVGKADYGQVPMPVDIDLSA